MGLFFAALVEICGAAELEVYSLRAVALETAQSIVRSTCCRLQTRFAAINQKVHNACGRCVAVTCTDAALCGGATTAVLPVVLVDDCGHCGRNDILLR